MKRNQNFINSEKYRNNILVRNINISKKIPNKNYIIKTIIIRI